MKYRIGLFLLFVIGACTITDEQDFPLTSQFTRMKLIDTFHNELHLDTSRYISEAEFHPMYMGPIKDSLYLNYWSGHSTYRTEDWFGYRMPDSLDMNIFVDTSRVIGAVVKFWIPPPPVLDGEDENSEIGYFRGGIKSYPVFVQNVSEDTLGVGYGEYIPLLMEAKDKDGVWRPVQETFFYGCGTGLTHFYLPSGEFLLTSCKMFAGDFETTLRLKFNKVYSNEFKDNIHLSQFEEAPRSWD